ncbi:unnamed protein product [Bemisia tabaci]|uniref:Pre-C2HC domain-containing protein n=1 Tax=Bemisia tabaci TaxID=7038 RepID=A0A9P0EY24_BEMTA|nr:unnamed protein product [Bemisia tabaci]
MSGSGDYSYFDRPKPPLRCEHKLLGIECDSCKSLKTPHCEHSLLWTLCNICYTKCFWRPCPKREQSQTAKVQSDTSSTTLSETGSDDDVFLSKNSVKNPSPAVVMKPNPSASNADKKKSKPGETSRKPDSCILGPALSQPQPMDTATPSDPAWKLVVSKRKTRHDPDSPAKVQPKKTKDRQSASVKVSSVKNPSVVNINNKFSKLDGEKEEKKTERAPPPIFVSFVADPSGFKKSEIDPIDPKSMMRIVNRSQVKIIPSSMLMYDKLIVSLKQKNDIVKFHTYQKASEKTIRAVVRGLPRDYLPLSLKSDFEQKIPGLVVKNVSQMRHQITKTPLPLFFVDFLSNVHVAKIWQIKSIKDFIVSLERPKGRREVIQCKNCLAFGHSRSRCYRDPRCLLCGDFHALADCPRPQECQEIQLPVFPSCVHCGEMHVGNYRGCKVYKQIRKKRMGKKPKDEKFVNHQFVPLRNLTVQGKSYASAVAGAKPQSKDASQSIINVQVPNSNLSNVSFSDKRIKTLEELVLKQSEQIERMMKVIEAFLPALVRGASLSMP